MSLMTLKHTKSPSGKTHALTDPKTGQAVTKHFHIRPQFDDQVQGDLIREFSRTIFPVVIGQLPVHVDPALLDKGQKAPSLDYLRGYLDGLEGGYGQGQQSIRDEVKRTREQIARLEAQRNGVSISEIAYGGPVVNQGPPPAAGAASIQINQVERPQVNRLSAGVRRVRDAEERGW